MRLISAQIPRPPLTSRERRERTLTTCDVVLLTNVTSLNDVMSSWGLTMNRANDRSIASKKRFSSSLAVSVKSCAGM
jgi:hypothetical protein